MPLFFIRHGETLLNAARTVQPAATPLAPRGLEQAERLAERVAKLKPAAILSSDMPRAWQTAEVIARHTGLEPLSTELLRERNFGDLRGRPYDSLSFDPLKMIEAPTNGESMAEFHARVAEAFEYAARLRATLDGSLLVVCHGLVIHALLENCIDMGAHQIPARIGNTSITRVIAQYPFTAELVNCTAHLNGTHLAEDAKSLSGG